ncbi:MAG: hypothetical protein CL885_00915 [Dehalococcoidia bacterium]|nr:hypothetical protein [Dehalococcoidia bacterium]|tara:strand:+ start:1463 stop:1666 length:204 start_codon:yes stop_codon:yes gene_type:complete
MSKSTLSMGSPKWIEAIVTRLEDELPYEEENKLVANAVRHYLEQDLSRCHEFIGTTIIEENYFDDLN